MRAREPPWDGGGGGRLPRTPPLLLPLLLCVCGGAAPVGAGLTLTLVTDIDVNITPPSWRFDVRVYSWEGYLCGGDIVPDSAVASVHMCTDNDLVDVKDIMSVTITAVEPVGGDDDDPDNFPPWRLRRARLLSDTLAWARDGELWAPDNQHYLEPGLPDGRAFTIESDAGAAPAVVLRLVPQLRDLGCYEVDFTNFQALFYLYSRVISDTTMREREQSPDMCSTYCAHEASGNLFAKGDYRPSPRVILLQRLRSGREPFRCICGREAFNVTTVEQLVPRPNGCEGLDVPCLKNNTAVGGCGGENIVHVYDTIGLREVGPPTTPSPIARLKPTNAPATLEPTTAAPLNTTAPSTRTPLTGPPPRTDVPPPAPPPTTGMPGQLTPVGVGNMTGAPANATAAPATTAEPTTDAPATRAPETGAPAVVTVAPKAAVATGVPATDAPELPRTDAPVLPPQVIAGPEGTGDTTAPADALTGVPGGVVGTNATDAPAGVVSTPAPSGEMLNATYGASEGGGPVARSVSAASVFVGFAAMLTVSTGPIGALGRLSLASQATCGVVDAVGVEPTLPLHLHPFQAAVGGHSHDDFAGMLVYNTLCLALMTVVSWVLMKLQLWRSACCALVLPLLFLYPGIVYAAATLATAWGGDVPVPVNLLGMAGLATSTAAPIAVWALVLRPRVFQAKLLKDRTTEGTSRLSRFFLGDHMWVSVGSHRHFVKRHRVCFDAYRDRNYCLLPAEFASIFVLAAVVAVPGMPCTPRLIAIAGCVVVWLLMLCITRPYIAVFDNTIIMAITLCTAGGACLAAVHAANARSPPPPAVPAMPGAPVGMNGESDATHLHRDGGSGVDDHAPASTIVGISDACYAFAALLCAAKAIADILVYFAKGRGRRQLAGQMSHQDDHVDIEFDSEEEMFAAGDGPSGSTSSPATMKHVDSGTRVVASNGAGLVGGASTFPQRHGTNSHGRPDAVVAGGSDAALKTGDTSGMLTSRDIESEATQAFRPLSIPSGPLSSRASRSLPQGGPRTSFRTGSESYDRLSHRQSDPVDHTTATDTLTTPAVDIALHVGASFARSQETSFDAPFTVVQSPETPPTEGVVPPLPLQSLNISSPSCISAVAGSGHAGGGAGAYDSREWGGNGGNSTGTGSIPPHTTHGGATPSPRKRAQQGGGVAATVTYSGDTSSGGSTVATTGARRSPPLGTTAEHGSGVVLTRPLASRFRCPSTSHLDRAGDGLSPTARRVSLVRNGGSGPGRLRGLDVCGGGDPLGASLPRSSTHLSLDGMDPTISQLPSPSMRRIAGTGLPLGSPKPSAAADPLTRRTSVSTHEAPGGGGGGGGVSSGGGFTDIPIAYVTSLRSSTPVALGDGGAAATASSTSPRTQSSHASRMRNGSFNRPTTPLASAGREDSGPPFTPGALLSSWKSSRGVEDTTTSGSIPPCAVPYLSSIKSCNGMGVGGGGKVDSSTVRTPIAGAPQFPGRRESRGEAGDAVPAPLTSPLLGGDLAAGGAHAALSPRTRGSPNVSPIGVPTPPTANSSATIAPGLSSLAAIAHGVHVPHAHADPLNTPRALTPRSGAGGKLASGRSTSTRGGGNPLLTAGGGGGGGSVATAAAPGSSSTLSSKLSPLMAPTPTSATRKPLSHTPAKTSPEARHSQLVVNWGLGTPKGRARHGSLTHSKSSEVLSPKQPVSPLHTFLPTA